MRGRRWFMRGVVWAGCAAVLILGSCVTYKGDIPMETKFPEEVYISPENGDGVQDELVVPLSVPEIKGLKPAGYIVLVRSESGSEIYSYGVDNNPGDNKWSLFGKKKAVPIPSEIRWDGRSSFGEFVNDGVYFLKAAAWDFDKNRGETPELKVIVDNTPPTAEISLPFPVFSPNGDGKQDFISIYQQNATFEDDWTGVIIDSEGEEVLAVGWEGVPGDFLWDGVVANGSSAPDGIYDYKLSAADRAGNRFNTLISGITIDRTVHPISISVVGAAFSPNGDRVKDTVRFSLEMERRENVVRAEFWVVDTEGLRLRTIDGVDAGSTEAEFDGFGDDRRLLSEGEYFGVLRAEYRNGDAPTVISEMVRLDTTAPYMVMRAGTSVFSPDGDGRKDSVIIYQSSSEELSWIGRMEDSAARTVREYGWKGRALAFDWDGKNSTGVLVPDGVYRYTVSSTDEAGNRGSYTLTGLRIDTRPTPVRIVPRKKVFSPNGDGIDDWIEFDCIPEIMEGITGWKFSVLDEKRNIVAEYGHHTSPSVTRTVSWDGRRSDGSIAEGIFLGRIEVEYEKGNLAETVGEIPILLDITPPRVEIKTSPQLFSPDGDGENDILTIQVKVSDAGAVKGWSAAILDPMGGTFMRIPSSAFSRNEYRWNGTSATGELVQSASDYTIVVQAEDVVGNASVTEHQISVDILVLREGDRLRISISSIYFKPFTPDYISVEPEVRDRNIATLDRLAVILNKFSDYRIQVEGHAVRVYWNDPKRWLTEEQDVLLPLSIARADAIRDALAERNINSARMTVSGVGGYKPIVPHSDLQNRWKSRRVEFYLIKK